MNKVIEMGRLVRDPEVTTTASGKTKAAFTVAVDRHIARDKVAPGQQTADFIRFQAWERLAQTIGQYVRKGDQILVEGRVVTRTYEQDGQKRFVTDLVAERIEFGGKASANATPKATASAHATAPATPTPTAPPIPDVPLDDDIPF